MKLNSEIAAIVTGGASGLGEAVVRALARTGVKISIFDLNAERGERIASEIGGAFYPVDVASEDNVNAGFDGARAAFGQERILINCAGGGNRIRTASRDPVTGHISHFPVADFQKIIEINLVGTFRCIAKSAAGMMSLEPIESCERGVIINTASVAAVEGQIGQAAYSASKAGIVGMTLPIARDLSSEGIRVNTILPGVFDTPLMHTAPERLRSALADAVPFPKRMGAPEEFASLALEMCRNGYFNGEHVRLDGAVRLGLG